MSERKLTQNLLLMGTKEQSVLPIRERDWTKIRNMIERVITGSTLFLIAASLVFGLFVAVIIGLIFLSGTVSGPLQVSPSGALNFVISSMVGIAVALLILALQNIKHVNQAKQQILNEMDLVQQDYTSVSIETSIASGVTNEEAEELSESVTDTFLK